MKAEKVIHFGSRESAELGNEHFKVVINHDKGMVPELCCRKEDGWYNAHWQPLFRANSGMPWNEKLHADFWKAPLLYDIAGNFPCCPNFGPGHEYSSYSLPPHGYTSDRTWKLDQLKSGEQYSAAIWGLDVPEHPFSYRKLDLVCRDEPAHYTSLGITNNGDRKEPYNCGWHNTLGTPFLESGCIIDNNAEVFAVPDEGTEFDSTGRLAYGYETGSMKAVKTRDGGIVDISKVPGVIGYTDFIAGAVPESCSLGWSSVVNPGLHLLYLTYFTGPKFIGDGEMPLHFYNYWMNYGGRSFSPWAAYEGGTDNSFCLGTENSVSHFANGLKSSTENPQLLGYPTYLELAPGESVVLNYATAFLPYEEGILDIGVAAIHPEENHIIAEGTSGKCISIAAQPDLRMLLQDGFSV